MTQVKPVVLYGQNTSDLKPGDDVGDLSYSQSQALTAAQKLQAFANAGGSTSLAANGYAKLPGGLIVQWGSASLAGDAGIVEPWVYDYAALDELAVAAWWTGRYRVSLDAGLRALQAGMPEAHRPRVLDNMRQALERLPAVSQSAPAACRRSRGAP